MTWPEGLNTYVVPAGAIWIESAPLTLLSSTREIGSPDFSDTTLQMSTSGLMVGHRPSANAATRYSDAGLLRPEGLKPPWRSRSRTAIFTASSGGGGVGAGAAISSSGR